MNAIKNATVPQVALDVPQGDASAYLAAIVASSDDAIISKNLNGIIASWNASAERIFGYKAEEAIGKHITIIIPEEHIQEEFTIIARLKKGERIDHFETIRRRKDGRLINVSITVSPIRDQTGTIIGASKVARDITERIAIEKALMEANQRKDEFLAMLAHELRNPLAPISNAMHVLEAPTISHETRTQASAMVRRQLAQMTRLLDDLLDISRITRGKIMLRHQPTVLADVLQVALEAAKPLIADKSQLLDVDLPDEPVMVKGDAARLAQVFSNLLNNASKYTDRGGLITVRVAAEGEEAVVTISDNGIGIPRDKLQSVFELFTQVDSSMERAQGGLGIGLTLVKSIVEMHHGTVIAYSEGSNRGSSFTIRLPLLCDSVTVGANEISDRIAPRAAQGKRVLVVDDNEASAKTLGWTMEMLGHEVLITHSAEDALKIAPAFKPDLALLDIGLPRMNGYDLCAALKRNPAFKHTTFVAQTGWGREEHIQRSKEAGFDHHLVKPVDMQAMQKVLEEGRG